MFNPFSKFDSESCIAYAVTRSIKNPVPWPEWCNNYADTNALNEFLTTGSKQVYPSYLPDTESMLYHPTAIRLISSHSERQIHPGSIGQAWRIELVRFCVPLRYTGIIRGISQYMGILNNGVVTSIVQFGNPYTDIDNGIVGNWYMRINRCDNQNQFRPYVNQLSPQSYISGMHYTEFTPHSGIWYPAHSEAGNNIRMIVPGGYEVSLYWECDSSITNIPVIGASIQGGIQSSVSEYSRNHFIGAW